jgi:hypothetical protein
VFQALTSSTIVNLIARRDVDPPLPAFDLALANLGVTFRAGIAYVLSLTGQTLSVRGSDGSTASAAVPASRDKTHTFVGAMVYGSATTSVRLYPKLQLGLPRLRWERTAFCKPRRTACD